MYNFVPSTGIEPVPPPSEGGIVSIQLRGQARSGYYSTKTKKSAKKIPPESAIARRRKNGINGGVLPASNPFHKQKNKVGGSGGISLSGYNRARAREGGQQDRSSRMR